MFWNQYNDKINYKMENNVTETISKLKSCGHNITIMTGRKYNIAKLTDNWLKQNNIYYDEIYFAVKRKFELCDWKEINIAIEDKPFDAIEMVNNNILVLLYQRPYNEHIKHKNIIVCKNWDDIFNNIKTRF